MFSAAKDPELIVNADAIARAADFFERSVVSTVPSAALHPAFVDALLRHVFSVDGEEDSLAITHAMTTQALAFLKLAPLLERPAIAMDHGFIADLLSAALNDQATVPNRSASMHFHPTDNGSSLAPNIRRPDASRYLTT